MSHTTVQNTVVDVFGDPIANAHVEIRLVQPRSTDLFSVVATTTTDANGVWTASLQPNSELQPAGTSYQALSDPAGDWTQYMEVVNWDRENGSYAHPAIPFVVPVSSSTVHLNSVATDPSLPPVVVGGGGTTIPYGDGFDVGYDLPSPLVWSSPDAATTVAPYTVSYGSTSGTAGSGVTIDQTTGIATVHEAGLYWVYASLNSNGSGGTWYVGVSLPTYSGDPNPFIVGQSAALGDNKQMRGLLLLMPGDVSIQAQGPVEFSYVEFQIIRVG